MADGRAQGPVHQPADARPLGCSRDRGRRRGRDRLRRAQSDRVRRPADPREGQDRRRGRTAGPGAARVAARTPRTALHDHRRRGARRRSRAAARRGQPGAPAGARHPRRPVHDHHQRSLLHAPHRRGQPRSPASLRTVARGPARAVAQLAGLQVDAELLGDQTGEPVPAPHPSRPPRPARDAQTLPARGRRPVADPPARASRAHAPRARRPARQRARGRAARERRGARAARPAVQVRRPARRRAPQQERIAEQIAGRHHEQQDAERAAAIAGATPMPPPRSRSRTAPIPSQPRPQPNPPPCPPPPRTTASRQRSGSVTWSRRPPSRCGCCARRRPSRSRKLYAPRPRRPRRRAISPTHRHGPHGPAGNPPPSAARRAARSPCSSGFWLAPYGRGAGECCVADLDVQRFLAVGVKERLQLRGVLEQARARVRRAGHPAQHAL